LEGAARAQRLPRGAEPKQAPFGDCHIGPKPLDGPRRPSSEASIKLCRVVIRSGNATCRPVGDGRPHGRRPGKLGRRSGVPSVKVEAWSRGWDLTRLAQAIGTGTNEFTPELDVRLHSAHQHQEFGLGVVTPPSSAAIELEQIVATTLSHGQPLAGYLIAVPPGKFICHDAPDLARPAAPASQCRAVSSKSSLVVSTM
jgi:hypothetical protein